MARRSHDGFREGIKNFADLSSPLKSWVTVEVIRRLSLQEGNALDDFVASMQAARDALRGGLSVFMSHSSRDKAFVRSLGKYLEAHGISVWLDEADLLAGEPLLDRLASAVKNTSLLIAVISKNSVCSPWVRKELALAVDREVKETGITVVPVLKDDCEIPTFIAEKFYLDFRTRAKKRTNRPVLVNTLLRLASQNKKAQQSRSERGKRG